jgi:signal transduction histidine kinase
LLELVNDLLDLSRISSGTVELHPQPFDVAELVEETTRLMRPMAAERDLTLLATVDLPEGARIAADPGRIKQILINLVGNAIKFTEQGRVALKVSEIPDGIAFAVADTGPGLRAEEQATVFDRFARTERSNRTSPGAGLGLAITRGLVELMEGEITVESEVGVGSIFSVRLPIPVIKQEQQSRAFAADVKKKSRRGREV